MGNVFGRTRRELIADVVRDENQPIRDVEGQREENEVEPLINQQEQVVAGQGVNNQLPQQDGAVPKMFLIRFWEAMVKFFGKRSTQVALNQPQGVNPPDENQQQQQQGVVARNVFIRFIVNLFTRPVVTEGDNIPQDREGDNQAPEGDNQAPEGGNNPPSRNYTQGMVPVFPGFKFKIKGPNDLKPMADLVKQKGELVNHVESIFKNGRDYRHNIILTFVGTMVVGILNTIVDGLLADHVPLKVRFIVLGTFSASFIVYFGGSICEAQSIYEPSLTCANASHSILIRTMNINRDALMVPIVSSSAVIEPPSQAEIQPPIIDGSAVIEPPSQAEIQPPIVDGSAEIEPPSQAEIELPSQAEIELHNTLERYCEIILQPLPISRQVTTSYIMMGSMMVALAFAAILKAAVSLSGSSSAPSLAPAPAPYFG